jgi:hypothetical protein
MAAGLGFKTFTTGEVLTAADTNGYLMQGILVFASAAARDSAITSPQEGQFAYLKDTNVTTYYTGSAWANVDTTGMTNPMTTTGDMIYSSSGSTPARLGIGSTGNVLTVAGGVPSWAAPAGGGGMTLINTGGTSLTGASVTIGSIPSGYVNLQLIVENFLPATNNNTLSVRVNNDSNANRHFINTAIQQENVSFNNTAWDLTGGGSNSASQTIIKLDIYGYANSTTWKMGQSNFLQNYHGGSSNMNIGIRQYGFNQTGAITSLVLFPGSGNFTSGTAYLYGVK